MLRTRVITALVLLAVILPVFYSASFAAFSVVALVFAGVAVWESKRLFSSPFPIALALLATAFLGTLIFSPSSRTVAALLPLFVLTLLFWVAVFIPILKFGLPDQSHRLNGILGSVYAIAIIGCFVAMHRLFLHSPLFLLSAMCLVWIADIGAYFSGKAFGKHKLAPSISPGKSWEGAIGGCLLVILISVLVTRFSVLSDTVPAMLLAHFGWLSFILILIALSALSVCGDLFESQLKRRAGMKDSSHLLPGHGGVLDRIDALIPVLPAIALLSLGY